MIAALVETLDLLLASLRAGYSVAQSLLMLADIAPHAVRAEFEVLRERVNGGAPITVGLAECRSRLGSAFRPLFELSMSAIRLGIPTETLIVQIQSEARHVQRERNESAAKQLSVRLTLPLVVCTLPSFLFLIIVPMIAGTLSQLRTNGSTP